MADKVTFDLVSPEQLVLSDAADMVTLPGADGDMGVMAGHTAVITTLRPGVITVAGGKEASQRFLVLGGFAEIADTKVTVLAEEAIPAAELEARIEAANEGVAKASEADKAAKQAYADNLTKLRAFA